MPVDPHSPITEASALAITTIRGGWLGADVVLDPTIEERVSRLLATASSGRTARGSSRVIA
ncbi:hypothetical protein [Sorangium sp. So ce1000]|uniref:hypothetical protein n=1 Tax=Sorangium sp. So ce1000 TaxID=3133325 RepID=UPI003F63AF14